VKIPKTFTLLGTTYDVLCVPVKDWEGEEDEIGYFLAQQRRIAIKVGDQQIMEHTFCHELCHAILSHMGEDKLTRNEKFVDVFGGLLHQAMTSSKCQ
jgi:hypothetical protein